MFGKRKEKHIQSNESFEKLIQFGFQKMGDFTTEDVFLIGYPKSGNTLLLHMIAHLVYGLRSDAPKSLINSCITEYYNNPWFFRHNPRHFFKSHELPKPEYRKVINIVRDGREAIRSYFYMLQSMNEKASLEKLYTSGGKCFVGTWQQHVESWLENPFNASILYLRYEDIIQHKADALHKICDFLEIERNPTEIQNVIHATSLENMKQLESDYSWQRAKSFKTWNPEGKFVRQGNASGYLEDPMIHPKWIQLFEEQSKQTLQKFNYLP